MSNWLERRLRGKLHFPPAAIAFLHSNPSSSLFAFYLHMWYWPATTANGDLLKVSDTSANNPGLAVNVEGRELITGKQTNTWINQLINAPSFRSSLDNDERRYPCQYSGTLVITLIEIMMLHNIIGNDNETICGTSCFLLEIDQLVYISQEYQWCCLQGARYGYRQPQTCCSSSGEEPDGRWVDQWTGRVVGRQTDAIPDCWSID